MYVTSGFSFWGVSKFNGGRFGGGYVSLIVVTVLYGLYDFLYEKTISTKMFIVVFARTDEFKYFLEIVEAKIKR